MKNYFFAGITVVALLLLAGATISWFFLLGVVVLSALIIAIFKKNKSIK